MPTIGEQIKVIVDEFNATTKSNQEMLEADIVSAGSDRQAVRDLVSDFTADLELRLTAMHSGIDAIVSA